MHIIERERSLIKVTYIKAGWKKEEDPAEHTNDLTLISSLKKVLCVFYELNPRDDKIRPAAWKGGKNLFDDGDPDV